MAAIEDDGEMMEIGGDDEETLAVVPDEPETQGDDYPDETPPVKKSMYEEDLYGELTMDELKEAFRLFDSDKLGYITLEIFGSILRELDDDWTEDDIMGILGDIDGDSNGIIDFEEFVKIMT